MTDLIYTTWRKSRSNTAGNCVEVALSLVGADWRKSSRSNAGGGVCVEVARNLPGIVGIRDSKNPTGPALVIRPAEWAGFVTRIQSEGVDG